MLGLLARQQPSKLLETDQVDEAFNVSKNKTNSIIDIFFLKCYLDLELLELSSWKFFFEKRKCTIPCLIKFGNTRGEDENLIFSWLSVKLLHERTY